MLTKQTTAPSLKVGPDEGLAEGQFTAYASVFGNKDSYGDVVTKGAFSNDLQRWEKSGNPIPLLFGHNMSDPDYNIGHVVDAKEDDTGLLVTAQIDLESTKGRQVYRMLKGRRINQMSFAYDVLDAAPGTRQKDDSDESESFNELRELKVYEVSVVTIGANQETEILAVKQVPEVVNRLAEGIKAGRVLSAKNEDTLRTAYQAIGDVLGLNSTDSAEEKASDTEPSHQAPQVHIENINVGSGTPAGPPREAMQKSSVIPSALLDAMDAAFDAEFAC
jgi:HK97 family phage prohead protease